MHRRLTLALLAAVWLAVAGWQALEHRRFERSARLLMGNRARDIAAAMSVVIRSQGRTAIVPRLRLEEALEELVRAAELESVTLLNASGEVAASAGNPFTTEISTLLRTREHWTAHSASFATLVALGAGVEGFGGAPALLPMEGPGLGQGLGPDGERGGRGRRFGRREGEPPPPPLFSEDPEAFVDSPFFDPVMDTASRRKLVGMMGDAPLTAGQVDQIAGLFKPGTLNEHRAETLRRTLTGRPLDAEMLRDTLAMALLPVHRPGPPPEQPPWMDREEYARLVEERGVLWFLVSIPTDAFHADILRDLRLRGIVIGVALLACLALAWAWRSAGRSAALEVQLVRSRETERHLEELNVTAAGLVHETKNPLNLIRGLAQMISREDALPGGTRRTALKITEEADRVTGRINQFLDYARPVQPKPRVLDLTGMVDGIFEVLACDREEKNVSFAFEGPDLRVLADENLLRQVLFNLILNAVQAVPQGGRVVVRAVPESRKSVRVEVRDNGPGVPPEHREDVFRPYFTESEHGTGLGLAVVRQTALAHHWEAACLPNEGGAVFVVRGITPAPDGAPEQAHG